MCSWMTLPRKGLRDVLPDKTSSNGMSMTSWAISSRFVTSLPIRYEHTARTSMQVAAAAAVAARREDVPEETIAREKAIYLAQAAESGKPEEIQERMHTTPVLKRSIPTATFASASRPSRSSA